MQIFKANIKNRNLKAEIIYILSLFVVAFIVNYYLSGIVLAISLLSILVSVVFKMFSIIKPNNINAIIYNYDSEDFSLLINDQEELFWVVDKKIILANRVFIAFSQQSTNNKISKWLSLNDFENKNDLRELIRILKFRA